MNGLYEAVQNAEKGKLTEEQKIASMLRIIRISNKEYGKLDKVDGYNCPKCCNKGFRYALFRTEYDYLSVRAIDCECKKQRQEYHRNRASGLPEGYTFESFQANFDWQRAMRDTAKKYLADKAYKQGCWFYAGGSVGAGKTHIVTALAREVIFERDVRYISWLREARDMKSAVNDSDYYGNMLYMMTSVDVLFIDDFFKGTVTDADKKLAYDILNDRYLDRKPTFITSELTIDKLDRVDSSIASRIFERCNGYILTLDGQKNMRFRKGA